jgi:hypothetical protein
MVHPQNWFGKSAPFQELPEPSAFDSTRLGIREFAFSSIPIENLDLIEQ